MLPEVYDAMDVTILNKIRQAIGFAWCDAKQLMFVSESNFGMGIRSISGKMLKSICRELEVQLNDDALVGAILRYVSKPSIYKELNMVYKALWHPSLITLRQFEI